MNDSNRIGLSREVQDVFLKPLPLHIRIRESAHGTLCKLLYRIYKEIPPYVGMIIFDFEKPGPGPGRIDTVLDMTGENNQVGIKEVRKINRQALELLEQAEEFGCNWVNKEKALLYQEWL